MSQAKLCARSLCLTTQTCELIFRSRTLRPPPNIEFVQGKSADRVHAAAVVLIPVDRLPRHPSGCPRPPAGSCERSAYCYQHLSCHLVRLIGSPVQAIEVRVGPGGVKAKWVRVELRKVETLPGGGLANTFFDFVGQSPINLWQASGGEYGALQTVSQHSVLFRRWSVVRRLLIRSKTSRSTFVSPSPYLPVLHLREAVCMRLIVCRAPD